MKSPWDAIVWWEIRRILFNVVMLIAGLAVISIMFIVSPRLVDAGSEKDFAEPFMWIVTAVLYGLLANLGYTIGWISELLWAQGDTSRTKPARWRVFWLGTAFSVALTFLPAILVSLIWAFQHIR